MGRYITVTSKKQNPAQFNCDVLDALDVEEGYEVAVTRIFHAPVFNVTEKNNKFTLIKTTNENNITVDYFIPPGFYAGTCDVLAAIFEELKKSLERGNNGNGNENLIQKTPAFAYAKSFGESSSLRILDAHVSFLIDMERDGDQLLLDMLGYCISDKIEKITINHYMFDVSIEPGFLYSNIVENSFINEQQSRLLSIFPVQSKMGYNYHEVINPVYCRMSAHSFIDVNFTLTDIQGKIMNMDPVHTSYYGTDTVIYPTILTLHVRKIV